MPDLAIERRLGGVVCGIDEVGRGPLAGPVVAAAVVLATGLPGRVARLIDDSKQLTADERRLAWAALRRHAVAGCGLATVEEIDQLNILRATLLAMRRAVDRLARRLGRPPEAALVDGNQAPDLGCPVELVIGGDGRCLSIAAASILAKLARDRMMRVLALRHPGYGWEHNVGYGTAEHRAALIALGPTRLHRRSFRPVAELMPMAADPAPPPAAADD